ncbi:thioesterase domain-containing protein [Micromonospora sp. BRA006-A]|nr:thioesterase domain-containing protein [Micromonospora sp. BRA006-A]
MPVHVLLGDRDEHVDPDRAAGWSRECVTEPQWHVFPGGHYFFLTDHLPEIIDLIRHIVASHTPWRNRRQRTGKDSYPYRTFHNVRYSTW